MQLRRREAGCDVDIRLRYIAYLDQEELRMRVTDFFYINLLT